MKSKLFFPMLILSAVLMGCKKDNKDEPTSVIRGSIKFNNKALGVRSNGVQLELWQYGYQLFSKIPVYIQQDGTFSASVYNGNYKLTLLRGNGPWADKTDSMDVKVSGTAEVDVTVDPYFIITNDKYERSGSAITATLNIQRVNTSKALELVRVYIGQTLLTDQNINIANAQKAAAAIPDINQPITVTVNVPASFTKDYAFMRVGVKAVGVAELIYSTPQQIALK